MFQVGAARYALPVKAVLEARSQQGMVRVAQGSQNVVGLLDVASPGGGTIIPVICARRLFDVAYPARQSDGTVVVMADPERPGHPLFGLRVDDVISVVDVDEPHIQAVHPGLRSHAPWLQAVIRMVSASSGGQEVLAQLLDADELARLLGRPPRPERATEAVALRESTSPAA